MNRNAFLLSAATLLVCSGLYAQAPVTTPTTTTPSGSYAVAKLDLSAGIQDVKDKTAAAPQKLFITMRDGKFVNAWFIRPFAGDSRLMVETTTVAKQGDKIAGDVEFRTAFNRGNAQVSLKLTLDLTVSGDKITGNFNITGEGSPYKSAKGTATGTLQAAADANDKLGDGSWTNFWGSNSNLNVGTQPALVENLADARPVWRSETYVPTGFGNAPDGRYFSRAAVTGNGGGGSSPVIANNTVYMYFFVPSQQSESPTKQDEAFADMVKKLNANEREKNLVLNHHRPLADDHIVAIDAATGAEKWRTVLPLRSPNHQTHKHRGTSGVPLVHGDTLYVPNHMSRLYAIDTKTGNLKWERPDFKMSDKAPSVSPPPNPSPFMIGDTLVFATGPTWSGKVAGLDPATGKEKWTVPGSFLMRWTNGGKERLITIVGLEKKQLSCIDPAAGKVLWSVETSLNYTAPLSVVVVGDMAIGLETLPKGKSGARLEGWRLTDTGATRAWQDDKPLVEDEHFVLLGANGNVYALAKGTIRGVNADTGKLAVERVFDANNGGHGPGSNAHLAAVGDRFLYVPEGQHGTAHLQFLDKDLKDICPLWLPPHVDTTAYNSQPITYPIVDGRFFIRGGDGIYCYDLRKK